MFELLGRRFALNLQPIPTGNRDVDVDVINPTVGHRDAAKPHFDRIADHRERRVGELRLQFGQLFDVDDYRPSDIAGRVEVFLQQHGRHPQHVAVVVKPAADIIGRERIGGL